MLVIHHHEEGSHPIWSALQSRFVGWTEVDLDATLLAGTRETIDPLDIQVPALELKPLPAARRWWELPSSVPILRRPVESHSSLSKLFYSPHEWVLGYAARLRAGRTEDLADGPLLYGKLAHRLFESFFATHRQWASLEPVAVDRWLDQALPDLIVREGALLLESGRGVDHQRTMTILERALQQLLAHLRSARVVTVEVEHAAQADYLRWEGSERGDDVGIRGDIDLLLTTESGDEIVMDAKWARQAARGEEIAQSVHLQLASYAYMRREALGSNQWPYPVYFIITTGNVLAADTDVFPNALAFPPQTPSDGGTDLEALWERHRETYRWRREQLDAGLVEVNCADAEPTERSWAPDTALNTNVEPNRYDDYRRLLGRDDFS